MATRLLPINFCLLFLTALLFMASCMNSAEASDEFVKASCKTTPYPALCYTSLSNYASSIKTSQRLLVKTALKVTLDAGRNTSSFLVKLSGNEKTRKSKTGPVGDCVELLRNVVDEISKSVKEMDRIKDNRDIRFRISNVQTWVSAAMTDENTCTEGMTGKTVSAKVKRMVTEKMEVLEEQTSNALCLVNSYASHH
ncbi:pectinesterase inhibitor 7-like [Silene latifolia]|uniref:pectinesterase inhibitor 7-like n=1 Tax=Silene latifolia TaxID=37657 RepID=UPI003D76F562